MAGCCLKLSPDHFHTPPVSTHVTYLSIRDFISAVIKTHKFRIVCPLNAVRGRDVTPVLLCISNSGSKPTLKKFPISRTHRVRMLRIKHIGI